MAVIIRPEDAADRPALHALNKAAFGGAAEADLVDRLRGDGDILLSLVAEEAGALVGHVVFSRLRVDGREAGASALAPVAVAPDRQGTGIGRALIDRGLGDLRGLGQHIVFVLGDPAYYHRFGFARDVAEPFPCAYQGAAFLALRLDAHGPAAGRLDYPTAFAGL